MLTVVNKYTHTYGSTSIYVGRPSALGNPFSIPQHGDRDMVIGKYINWLAENWNNTTVHDKLMMLASREKMGLNTYLVCYCAPLSCHAGIIKIMVGCIVDSPDDPITAFNNYFNK